MPANNYPSYRDTINRIGICLCIMLALIQGTSLAWALLSGWLSVILPAESAYFTGVLIETGPISPILSSPLFCSCRFQTGVSASLSALTFGCRHPFPCSFWQDWLPFRRRHRLTPGS